MEDAVRQLLSAKGVTLDEFGSHISIPGFILLGVAKRVPEFGEINGASVNVWHIPSDILPISRAELERWSVDAPSGRHWILSQRNLPEDFSSMLPLGSEVVAWGPDEMSVWFGDAILSGDLTVSSPKVFQHQEQIGDKSAVDHETNLVGTIAPVVNLDSWLVQSGLEGALTYPVLLCCKIWEVNGSIVSPEGDIEENIWSIIEDPWSSSITIFKDSKNMIELPPLRLVHPPDSRWKSDEVLISSLPSILDTRRQGETEQKEDSIRSVMLEWWRVELESIEISSKTSGLPAWVIEVEGREDSVLHGINGRTYPLS